MPIRDAHDLDAALDRCQSLLMQIGFAPGETREWLSQVTWAAVAAGGWGGMFPAGQVITAGGRDFWGTPYLNVFTTLTIPELDTPWLELELLFPVEDLTFSPHSSKYKPDTGSGLWQILRAFSGMLGTCGVYLTDEVGDGQTWQALQGGAANLWSFDLALIPHEMARHFTDVPRSYEKAVFPYGVGLARIDFWTRLPWA